MIKHISFANFKGASATHEFAPLTVFTGRNFAGKTTVRDALYVACLGYHPALAKTNKGTFQLASASVMTVNASADNSRVERAFTLKGKTVNASHLGDIDEDSKEWKAAPLAVLRPELFTTCPAKERLRMLASLSGGDAVKAAIEAVGKIAVLYKLAAPVDIEGMDALATAIEKKATEAGQTITRLNGTLATFADLDADHAPAGAVNLEAAMKKARDAARVEQQMIFELERLEKLSTAASRAAAAMGENPAVNAKDVERQLADARAAHGRAATEERAADEVLSGANNAIANLEREIAKLRAVRQTMPTLDEVIAEIDFCETNILQDEEAARHAYYSAGEVKTDAQTRLQLLQEAERANNGEIVLLRSMESCPTCKSCAPGWKDEALKFYEGKRAEIENGITAAASAVMASSDAFEKAKQAMLDAELHNKRLARLESHRAFFDAQRRLKQADAEVAAAEKIVSEAESRYGRAQQQESEAADAVATLEEQLSLAAANAVNADAVARCPAPEVIAAARDNAEAATAARIEAEAEQAAAQAANEKSVEQSQRFQQAATTREQLATAEADKKKHALNAGKVRDEMEQAVNTAYEPIIKAANMIGNGVMKKPLDVHEGEIGVWYDAFVPFEIISGTEQLIALAAIQAALSAQHGGIVIIDEFSRVDEANKMKLAVNLAALVDSCILKQVIIFDHDSAGWRENPDAAWKIIEVA